MQIPAPVLRHDHCFIQIMLPLSFIIVEPIKGGGVQTIIERC